jgi:adenylate kinase family enzyme
MRISIFKSYNPMIVHSNNQGRLFITGLSGSGKSTLADRLGKEMDIPVIHLDGWFNKRLREKFGAGINKTEVAYKEGIKLLLEETPERCIIEGGQLVYCNRDELMQQNIIILRVSLIKSILRAIKRDFEKEHWKQYGHIDPLWHVKINLQWYKHCCR